MQKAAGEKLRLSIAGGAKGVCARLWYKLRLAGQSSYSTAKDIAGRCDAVQRLPMLSLRQICMSCSISKYGGGSFLFCSQSYVKSHAARLIDLSVALQPLHCRYVAAPCCQGPHLCYFGEGGTAHTPHSCCDGSVTWARSG